MKPATKDYGTDGAGKIIVLDLETMRVIHNMWLKALGFPQDCVPSPAGITDLIRTYVETLLTAAQVERGQFKRAWELQKEETLRMTKVRDQAFDAPDAALAALNDTEFIGGK